MLAEKPADVPLSDDAAATAFERTCRLLVDRRAVTRPRERNTREQPAH